MTNPSNEPARTEPARTVLAEVRGYTPLIDSIVQKHGVMVAAVFGRMWRYTQMSSGICYAKQQTIADELGLTRVTVNTHIATLVADHYLKDLTPDLINQPHQYADTGKAGLKVLISAEEDDGVKNFDTATPPAVKNFDTPVREFLTHKRGGESAEGTEKREKRGAKAPPPPRAPRAADIPELVLFRDVTGQFPARANYSDVADALHSIALRLGHAPAGSDLEPYYSAWCARAYNPRSLTWLTEWACAGNIPDPRRRQADRNRQRNHMTDTDRQRDIESKIARFQ